MLDTESNSGGNTGSLGLVRGCSVWFANPPGGLVWAGGDPRKFSLLVVLWDPCGMLLNEGMGELEGELTAGVVF